MFCYSLILIQNVSDIDLLFVTQFFYQFDSNKRDFDRIQFRPFLGTFLSLSPCSNICRAHDVGVLLLDCIDLFIHFSKNKTETFQMNETVIKFSLPFREWMKIIALKLFSTQFLVNRTSMSNTKMDKILNDEIKLDYIDQREFPFRVFFFVFIVVGTPSKPARNVLIAF